MFTNISSRRSLHLGLKYQYVIYVRVKLTNQRTLPMWKRARDYLVVVRWPPYDFDKRMTV